MTYHVRYGYTEADVVACQKIAWQFHDELPKLLKPQLYDAILRNELIVAESDDVVVGFVRYRARLDGIHKIHELAVHRDYQKCGIGRNLLYAVPCPIQLFCPADIEANRFYLNAGMTLKGVQIKTRTLNLWQLKRLVIFCQGGNERFVRVARASGMAYATRSDYKAMDYPFMIDAPFKDKHWNWKKHLASVNQHRPVMALTRDYGRDYASWDEMVEQVEAFRSAGIMRIFVCPKAGASIRDIPQDCGIGISVESSYEGYYPDFRGLSGRQVHLLGGTPQQWLDLIPKIEGYGGKVISMDGSSHETSAKVGTVWDKETLKWSNKGAKADYHNTMVTSCRRIVEVMNASDDAKQLVLL